MITKKENQPPARQEGETKSNTPIMDDAMGWHDRRDLLSQIGMLEMQLSAKQDELESLKAAQGWIPEIVQKSAPAMKALRVRLGRMTHDERQSLLESALEAAKSTPPVERSVDGE